MNNDTNKQSGKNPLASVVGALNNAATALNDRAIEIGQISEQKDGLNAGHPEINTDAVIGHFLVDNVYMPAGHAVTTIVDLTDEKVPGTKSALNHAGNLSAAFVQMAPKEVAARTVVLGMRATQAAMWVADKVVDVVYNPAVEAFNQWDPQNPYLSSAKQGVIVVGQNIGEKYTQFNTHIKGVEYPNSVPYLAASSTAAVAVGVTVFHATHPAMEQMLHGEIGLDTLAYLPYVVGGKVANLFTIKPTFTLAKTTANGFLGSDWYHRHEGFKQKFETLVEPVVNRAHEIIEQGPEGYHITID